MSKTILIKSIVLSVITLSALQLRAQNKYTFKPYGFIRNDFYYDSRQSFETAGGLFYIVPKEESYNLAGQDQNDISTSNYLSIASRFGLNISGPKVGKVESTARFETDFAGFSGSTTMLRIRQAFCKLAWTKYGADSSIISKNELLVGQTWHPFFGDVVPDIQSLATGSPFQAFNRSPMVKFDWGIKKFRITGAAIYQFQYSSTGPLGSSPSYLGNNNLPELYAGFDYKKPGLILGAGIDIMQIRPRVKGDVIYGDTVISGNIEEKLTCIAYQAYAQYDTPGQKLSIKAKTYYGDNMSQLLLLGGYGVNSINFDGTYEYSNLKNSTSWLDITYNFGLIKLGFFAGYMKNLGSDKELLSKQTTYVFGFNNIDYVYRLAPEIVWQKGNWTFGIEYEKTTVAYGTLNLSNGCVDNSHEVSNNRIIGVLMYNF